MNPTPVLFSLPGNETLEAKLIETLKSEKGRFELRHFPDDETYLRIDSECRGRDVILLETLRSPDTKILPLIFFSETLRRMGVRQIGLVAPYLAYMRQDAVFHSGEALSSKAFASLISHHFDWMITIDPHLHRRKSLNEIYTIPTRALHAAPLLAQWVSEHVPDPLFIGPDQESEQWVRRVAETVGAPWLILQKTRSGDKTVAVSVPDVERWKNRTPVLVDDIISTARTMIETVEHLKKAGIKPPVCLGVHAVFAGRAYEELKAAGAAKIVTCNTIPHPSNVIDVSSLLAKGIAEIYLQE